MNEKGREPSFGLSGRPTYCHVNSEIWHRPMLFTKTTSAFFATELFPV